MLGLAAGGVGSAALAGCGLFDRDSTPAAEPMDNLEPLLTEAVALAAAYDRAVAAQPGLAGRLSPLADDHRAHARELAALIGKAVPSASTSGEAPASRSSAAPPASTHGAAPASTSGAAPPASASTVAPPASTSGAVPPAPTSGAAPPAPTFESAPPASASPAAPPVSAPTATAGAVLARLRAAEQTAQRNAVAVCAGAPAGGIELIGSIAACRATHAEALR